MLSEQFLIDVILRRDDVPEFSGYPFNLNAVKSLESLRLHPQVTCFVGENGSGKSTLLEAIAVSWGFNAEGGTKTSASVLVYRIPNYINTFEYHVVLKGRGTASFCEPKVSLTLPQK